MKIIAHKGGTWKGIQENSVEGFRKCAENFEIDMIELDLRLVVLESGVGRWVVCHDETMERLLGIDAWLSEHWSKFPSLEIVLIMLSGIGRKMSLYIDLKGLIEIRWLSDLVTILQRYPQVKSSIACFDTENLLNLLHLKDCSICPSWIKLGLITSNDLMLVRTWKRLGDLDFISCGLNVLEKGATKELQGRDLEIYVYTVDNILLTNRYLEMGIDGIVTNYPIKMISWIKGENPKNKWFWQK